MKKNYTLFLILICYSSSYAQERFFTFVEGWRSEKAIEYDSCFLSVGLGSTAPYENHIQFTKLSKQGDSLDNWTFKLDSTSSTEFVNSQTINSIDAGNMTIGATSIYESDPWTATATQLKFNNDFTEYLNDSWFYNSSCNCPTQFRAGLSENSHTIYAAIGSFNGTLNLIASKADFDGNIIWEQSYSCGVYCHMEPRHIIPAYDGGYLFISDEKRDIWQSYNHTISTIIKRDSLGTQQWQIYPGGIGFPYTSEYLLSIPTDDSNYLCVWTDNHTRTGNVNISYQTNPDATIWFAKIAPDGTKLWEKNIQSAIDLWDIDEVKYQLTQIIKISDDNIVITGKDQIIKLTQDAEVIWAREVTPDFLEVPDANAYIRIKGITQTTDSGFICAGAAYINPGSVFPEFTQTGFVVKVDEYGCLEPDCHLNDPVPIEEPTPDIAQMLLFPNPANEYITLQYDILQSYQELSLSITDLRGRQVYSKVLVQSEDQVVISTNQFPAGQYFCNLKADGQVMSRKFVVMK